MFIFASAFVIGLIFPLISISLVWKFNKTLRLHLATFIILLVTQIAGEAILAMNELGDSIKYFSALFVGGRILHLFYMLTLIKPTLTLSKLSQTFFYLTLVSNSVIWPIIFVRLISRY